MATSKKPRKGKKPDSHITIGADPEFFIRRVDTGAPHPICGLLGGTKGKPLPIGPYGAQEDNVMAEYNIPPVTSSYAFAEYIHGGRQAIVAELDRKFPGEYTADDACARLFPHQLLRSEQAQVFGCSPDFDSYAAGSPHQPVDRDGLRNADGEWRFCGGHVHLGFKHMIADKFPDYVVALFADVYLGLPLVRYDGQGRRRSYYGTPGRYRPTKWGIEYRPLSNKWTFDIGLTDTVGTQAQRLGEFLIRPPADIRAAWAEVPWDSVRTAISTEDAPLAERVIQHCHSIGMEV